MMAKREEEMEEIRSKSMEDNNEEIIDRKGELFMLRLQKSSRGEFKSSEFNSYVCPYLLIWGLPLDRLLEC
ncbi:60S ribosomal protein L29 [Asimina triloba]